MMLGLDGVRVWATGDAVGICVYAVTQVLSLSGKAEYLMSDVNCWVHRFRLHK
jgi:hypothetical protein